MEEVPTDAWMVRPCELYKEEFKDCDSIKGRFHQYFIYGQIKGCQQWKTDYNNCMMWRKKQDINALNDVIASEHGRRSLRVKGMVANDVWTLRTQPMSSSEWNRPLPEHISKDYEISYLHAMKTKSSNDSQTGSCTIL